MSKTTQFQFFLLVLILGFLTGPRIMEAIQGVIPEGTPAQGLTGNEAQVVSLDTPNPVLPQRALSLESPYERLSLEAKSAYVWDIEMHRELFGKNEHAQLPLASVAKMMLALVATEILPHDPTVTISLNDIREEGNNGLRVGERWSLQKLLQFTLVASSNDGASAIAGAAGAVLSKSTSTNPFTSKKLFVDKMNEKARLIGLQNTFFLNESGLDVESLTSGAYGSARDMAMLFEYVFRQHPELFQPTTYKALNLSSENNIVHHVTNTNETVERISGIIGSKTGYTDLAGGNLVVILDIGIKHPVAIAVLGSTRDGRFTDVEKLIAATVETITGDALPHQ